MTSPHDSTTPAQAPGAERFGTFRVECRLGQPIAYHYSEFVDVVPGDGGYGWRGTVTNPAAYGRKKPFTLLISPLRIQSGPSVYWSGVTLDADILFHLADKDEALVRLKDAIRARLREVASQLELTVRSIDA